MQFRNFLLPDENFCNSQKKDVGMMLLDNSNWLKWTAVIGSLFSVLYIINWILLSYSLYNLQST